MYTLKTFPIATPWFIFNSRNCILSGVLLLQTWLPDFRFRKTSDHQSPVTTVRITDIIMTVMDIIISLPTPTPPLLDNSGCQRAETWRRIGWGQCSHHY